MSNPPYLSVVMGVYNGETYLSESINSILSQKFNDFEFIIVDDASTDATSSIVNSYCDDRIVVLRNEKNLGLTQSLNRALRIASGRYIARQDADDLSHPNRFLRQVAFLDANPEVGVVATRTEWIDEKGERILIWHQPCDNAGIQETLVRYCCITHGSTVYRRKAACAVDGYNTNLRTSQDYDLWLRLSEMWDIVSLPEVLYFYRLHQGMASVEKRQEQEQNAKLASSWAMQRRVRYASLALGLRTDPNSPRIRHLSRRRMAQRFVWWSTGARSRGQGLALRLLLIAMLFDPTTKEIWSYIGQILKHKYNLFGSQA